MIVACDNDGYDALVCGIPGGRTFRSAGGLDLPAICRSGCDEPEGGIRGVLPLLLALLNTAGGRPEDLTRMYVSHFFMNSFDGSSILDVKYSWSARIGRNSGGTV